MYYSSPTVYSSGTRSSPYFKDSDTDSSPQDLDSAHYRHYDAVTYYFLHRDSMLKKIQRTFSIYFLNSNDLVPMQYRCLFVRLGTVSGSVKATHVTNLH